VYKVQGLDKAQMDAMGLLGRFEVQSVCNLDDKDLALISRDGSKQSKPVGLKRMKVCETCGKQFYVTVGWLFKHQKNNKRVVYYCKESCMLADESIDHRYKEESEVSKEIILAKIDAYERGLICAKAVEKEKKQKAPLKRRVRL